MPGRQVAEHGGLEFRVSPDYWLRRWLGWPFYFESHNPSFRVDIKRVAKEPEEVYWHEDSLYIAVVFADQSSAGMNFEIPQLAIGEADRVVLRDIFTHHPGQTLFRLPTSNPAAANSHWQILYSYQVRTEEQLWLSGFGTLLAIATAIGASAPGWLKLFE